MDLNELLGNEHHRVSQQEGEEGVAEFEDDPSDLCSCVICFPLPPHNSVGVELVNVMRCESHDWMGGESNSAEVTKVPMGCINQKIIRVGLLQ